jgi:large subunit ribosomal protein L17
MRHRKAGSKFNRNSSHRKAMFRNMVTSLLKNDRIKTTDQRAKELRGWADHIITLAKRGDLHARRQAMAIVMEKTVVHKIFEEAPKRFASVSGGYTRVIKLGRRQGDAAMMSLIELVSPEVQKPKKKTAKKKTAVKKKPAQAAASETEKATKDEAAEKLPPAQAVAEETKAAKDSGADEKIVESQEKKAAADVTESESPDPAAKDGAEVKAAGKGDAEKEETD